MKKLVCLLAALLLAFCLPALAEEIGVWDFDADYCELDGHMGAGGDIAVPGEIDGSTVDVIQTNVFSSMDAITSLTLPDTLLQLKDSAVCWCGNLTSVELPESLIAIGERNLYACPLLTEAVIPAGVRFIGESSFSYDESLRRIVFEGVCPVIGSACFTALPEDAVIYVPGDQLEAYRAALEAAGCTAAVQPSGQNAVLMDNNGFDEADFDFDETTGTITAYNAYATYLSIPKAIGGVPVRAIGDNAFEFHYYLAVLELPEGLEAIGDNAFAHCETLQYVSFPDSLKTIGDGAFDGGYYARALNLTGVETIGDSAFRFSRITGELTLSDSLVSIGANAFENSFHLSSLSLPASLQRVGSRAFANCALTYMAFDLYTPIDLASDAFEGNDALADLDLPWDSSIANRDAYAALLAQQCPSCTVWINNPESAGGAEYPVDVPEITTFENGVWTAYSGDAADLTTWATYAEVKVSALGSGLFKGSQTIRSFYPHHCGWFTTIGSEAFEGSSVEYVELFPSITTIGARAFANCAQLEELTLPESLTEIGEGAFEGLTGLKKAHGPLRRVAPS
ncbi:MAG: leucine-rich repeat domain-containing protein [Clostridiales bacterium]|nr:leucine-rich repeat domain-containing protein [Clostridiales bacterium]MDY2836059.1 leucine-rich repeat domain-containing protein [Candidatus Aphodomonas sp.]